MGTLLAFAAVAVSVLVIRYIPPNEHLLSSVSESSSIVGHSHNMLGVLSELREGPLSGDCCQGSIPKGGQSHGACVDNEAYLSNLYFSGIVIILKPILLFNYINNPTFHPSAVYNLSLDYFLIVYSLSYICPQLPYY